MPRIDLAAIPGWTQAQPFASSSASGSSSEIRSRVLTWIYTQQRHLSLCLRRFCFEFRDFVKP
ncbi:hypothetical protein CDO52_06920 [Nocardiopsis gilva YIM 90087]|uniref:Uncharacterized protein n=1 Tax=Nocardiopsis gilva YIM 90087 TaxID=1235441 RepID=A0A223S357_9ACTN|nr:hypothetical protein CDO52_06920 [Nocardiopsis gilva YIM 90087]